MYAKLWLNPLGAVIFLWLKHLNRNNRNLLQDLIRYEADQPGLTRAFFGKKEFRNVFYLRTRQAGGLSAVLTSFCRRFFKEMDSLILECPDIGGGLFIQHGLSTIVAARSIGQNCQINQQVTVGYNDDSGLPPVIGDNVSIFAGAKVIGNIRIGNNVKIGANAVVIRDVPDNSLAVGVPAVIKPLKPQR